MPDSDPTCLALWDSSKTMTPSKPLAALPPVAHRMIWASRPPLLASAVYVLKMTPAPLMSFLVRSAFAL